MKIKKIEPTVSNSDGVVCLSGLNKEQYIAAVEELEMIMEMCQRLEEAMNYKAEFEKRLKG